MASILIKPVSTTTAGGWPAIIDAIDPTDTDLMSGTIHAPAGQFEVRWDASGYCRDQNSDANLNPKDADVADVIDTVMAIK